MNIVDSNKEYWAHKRESADGKWEYQSVAEHLKGTAELCKEFAKAFGAEAEGEAIGILHDLGKYSDGFQDRLLNNGEKVDHSTAGAVHLAERKLYFSAACVAGHHGGLQDFGNMRTDRPGDNTLHGRLKKAISASKCIERYINSGMNIPENISTSVSLKSPLQASFWTRMLYSCLVDADYLDTEKFMLGEVNRSGADDIETLMDKLYLYIENWQNPTTELNRARCEILNSCLNSGNSQRGIFTLTVPTGGGKTVASLAFALRHAIENGMTKVIYVVPYTSIIEQNAAVFRNILGDGNVLEHHSGVQFELDENSSPEEMRKALATEDWDMPIVVTTAVQFFESIYANKSSKCRKLHNIANSVIVLDEAQMLPLAQLEPCVAAMAALVEEFHSTVVLCTATQPSLNEIFGKYAPNTEITEICPQKDNMYDIFKRVSFRQAGKLSDSELAEQLSTLPQVLCVVNSRRAAQSIFDLLPGEGKYHLSSLMTPAHRRKILAEIRTRLKNNEPCRVVSTSIIEAGVDVDFPSVYREIAGLDSILQAAGRCNREGRNSAEESIVTIFERNELPPVRFQMAIGATKEAISYSNNLGSPEAIECYFNSLLSLNGDYTDRDGIINAFEKGIKGCMFPFRTVAEKFRFIEQNTYTVYVPCEGCEELIYRLRQGKCSREIFRKLGQFAVSIYENHFNKLKDAGILLTDEDVYALDNHSAILKDMKYYRSDTGLVLDLNEDDDFS